MTDHQSCGYFGGAKIPPGCRKLLGAIDAMQQEIRRLVDNAKSLRRELDHETSAHGRTVDELCFWKFQAIRHRAYASLYASGNFHVEPDEVDEAKAERELELCRQHENAERCAHAEAPRDIGS